MTAVTARAEESPRFRFSLKTLFVVITGLCLVLGFVSLRRTLTRERRAAMEWADVHGVGGTFILSSEPRGSFPWWLWIVGERSVGSIVVDNVVSDDKDVYLRKVEELRTIFPEARIEDVSQWAFENEN